MQIKKKQKDQSLLKTRILNVLNENLFLTYARTVYCLGMDSNAVIAWIAPPIRNILVQLDLVLLSMDVEVLHNEEELCSPAGRAA